MPDLTISLTTAQAQRVAAALGKRFNLGEMTEPGNPATWVPRSATLAEAHEFLLRTLKDVVKEEELKATVIPEL